MRVTGDDLVAEGVVESDRIHDVLVPLEGEQLLASERVPHLVRVRVRVRVRGPNPNPNPNPNPTLILTSPCRCGRSCP